MLGVVLLACLQHVCRNQLQECQELPWSCRELPLVYPVYLGRDTVSPYLLGFLVPQQNDEGLRGPRALQALQKHGVGLKGPLALQVPGHLQVSYIQQGS